MKPELECIKEQTLKDYPVNLILEITTACNLKCTCCPHPNMVRPKNQTMDENLYRQIIDQVSPETTVWFAFMGEPLLFDGIIGYIEYATQKGVKTALNTNGMLLRKYANDLIYSGIDKVYVSVDAMRGSTYEKIRKGGSLIRVEDGVAAIAGKLDVTVQFVVSDENRKEEDDFIHYWTEHGVKVKVRRRLGWGQAVDAPDLDMEHCMPCPWLMRQMVILYNGEVAQCDADYEGKFSAGNVIESSIYGIWNSALLSRRQRHIDGDFNFEPCKNCKDWQVGKSRIYLP